MTRKHGLFGSTPSTEGVSLACPAPSSAKRAEDEQYPEVTAQPSGGWPGGQRSACYGWFQVTSRQGTLGSRQHRQEQPPGPLPSEPGARQAPPGAGHTDSLAPRRPGPPGARFPCSPRDALSCTLRGLFEHSPLCPSSLKLLALSF